MTVQTNRGSSPEPARQKPQAAPHQPRSPGSLTGKGAPRARPLPNPADARARVDQDLSDVAQLAFELSALLDRMERANTRSLERQMVWTAAQLDQAYDRAIAAGAAVGVGYLLSLDSSTFLVCLTELGVECSPHTQETEQVA